MKNVKCKIFVALLIFIAPRLAHGAEFYFGAPAKEVGVGQLVEVGVFLNTDSVSINAVEGAVIFTDETLSFKQAREGGSIISFWVEHPAARDQAITFSGIIPGGYTGNRGYLFSLVFEATKKGEATVEIKDMQALLNDGQGTAAGVRQAPLRLLIAEKAAAPGFLPPYDGDPPEPFVPEVARDPNVFYGKWFLAFTASDKGSGIDHFDVSEAAPRFSLRRLLRGDAWISAESPYMLRDQARSSMISVKAIDKARNARVVTLEAVNPLPWYENYLIWGILIGLALIAYFMKLWRSEEKRKARS